MVEEVTKLRVFVASPKDVSNERDKVKAIIDELNHGIAESKRLILQYVGWETDAWPDFVTFCTYEKVRSFEIGGGAQEIGLN